MDPMTLYALGAAGQGLGGLFGNLFAGDGGAKERAAALAAIENANVEAGPSAFGGLESDPRVKALQMSALEDLYNKSKVGGMDPEAKAALAEATAASAANNRGQQGAIKQDFAMRGAGGSGAELAARLQAAQGNANQVAMTGTRAAADASARANEALRAAGGLATQVRGQGWGEQTDVAGAKDRTAEFNAGQRLGKANAIAGLHGVNANADDAERQRKTNIFSGAGGAVGGLAGFFGGK